MSIGISGSVTEAATVARASRRSDRGHAHQLPIGCARATTASRRAGGRAPRCAGRRDRSRRVPDRPAARRRRSTPLTENTCSSSTPTSAATDDGATPTPDSAATELDRVVGEQLVVQRPDRLEPGQQPAARLVGALREGEEPATGVVAVVGHLLDALDRDRPTARGRGEAASRSSSASRQVENSSSRTIVTAKSPLSASTRRTLRNSRSPRKNASASSGGTGEPSGRAGTTDGIGGGRARQQQPRLAEQVERDVGQRDVLLEVGRAAAPLREPVGVDERVVAEHQAVRRELVRVDAVRDGRVDAGERVLEVGAEGPLGVVAAQQPVVHGVVVGQVARIRCVVHRAITCGGRRRGCRRTWGAGRPCRRSARTAGPSRRGSRR